jgi:hypothetical protein
VPGFQQDNDHDAGLFDLCLCLLGEAKEFFFDTCVTEPSLFRAKTQHQRTVHTPLSPDALRNRAGEKFRYDFLLPINTVASFQHGQHG